MKLSIIIFTLIILLAIIGIVIIKLKFDSTDNMKWTDIIQVFLTFALVLVTGWNAYLVKQTVDEMAKSRIAQEEAGRESIKLSQQQIQKHEFKNEVQHFSVLKTSALQCVDYEKTIPTA